MGTYFTTGATRRDVIAEVTAGWEGKDGTSHRVLRHTAVGNVLWSLNETVYGGEVPKGRDRVERWIGCHLLVRSGGDWGYKPMDESMGPYYFHCPLSYLDAATAPVNTWAREWREKVRAWHAERAAGDAKAKALKVGDRITITGIRPTAFRLESLKPIRARADDGRVYRLTRTLLRRATVAA